MSFFQKDELRLLWPFYLETIISTLLFIYPAFWVIYFQAINLSLLQIGILMTAIAISSFICEIPTGAIADIFGRKFSTLLGYFLVGIIMIAMFFFTSFWSLFVLFILWGVSGTFISGARDAWIADNLKFRGRPELIKEYYIKNHSFVRLSLFLAGFAGVFFVSKFGMGIIWFVTGISMLVSGLVLSFVSEKRVILTCPHSLRGLYDQSAKSIKYGMKHNVLFYMLAAVLFIGFASAFSGDFLWQPLLKQVGLPLYAFGYLFSGITLLGTITPYLAKPLLRIMGSEKRLLALMIGVQCVFGVMTIFVSHWFFGVLLCSILVFAWDIEQPVEQAYAQKFIPSRMRATIISFRSMLMSISFGIGSPIGGYLADTIGIKQTIAIGGLIIIPAAIFYMAIKDKKRQ
jgi:DHA3 family tetracycline resistance protein-like MFS transporter